MDAIEEARRHRRTHGVYVWRELAGYHAMKPIETFSNWETARSYCKRKNKKRPHSEGTLIEHPLTA